VGKATVMEQPLHPVAALFETPRLSVSAVKKKLARDPNRCRSTSTDREWVRSRAVAVEWVPIQRGDAEFAEITRRKPWAEKFSPRFLRVLRVSAIRARPLTTV